MSKTKFRSRTRGFRQENQNFFFKYLIGIFIDKIDKVSILKIKNQKKVLGKLLYNNKINK